MAEFQADVMDSLVAPADDNSSIDEFWSMLHGLLEILTAYRFLFRDTDSLIADHPRVGSTVRGFTRALIGTLQLHIQSLGEDGVLTIEDGDSRQIAQQLALVMLYGERLNKLLNGRAADASNASTIVTAVLSLLSPYAHPAARTLLRELESMYWEC